MQFDPRLIGLLTKYGSKKLHELRSDDLINIATVLKVEVDEDGVKSALDLLSADGDNAVSDWVAAPGNVDKLKQVFAKKPEITDTMAIKCPACQFIFELQISA